MPHHFSPDGRPLPHSVSAEAAVRNSQLIAAQDACRAALVDHEAGLLSDGELRRTLVRVGMVCRIDEVWLLDLELGDWRCFDGITLVDHQLPFRRRDVERWRRGLDSLAAPEVPG